MYNNDHIQIKGDIAITVYDSDGNIKFTKEETNLVLTAGKNFVAAKLANSSVAISQIAIGSGTTAPAPDQTALSAIIGAKKAISTITSTNNVTSITASFSGTSYAASSVTEAGLFLNDGGSTMICRTTFGSFAILSTDTIGFVWNLTIV